MPEIFSSYEKKQEVKKSAIFIKQIAESIENKGMARLKFGSRESTIRPPENCELRIRHERRPKGEEAFIIELIWDGDSSSDSSSSFEVLD